ncbi:MAG: ABC transporter ATP-binding protein [Bacteroidota bacterium]
MIQIYRRILRFVRPYWRHLIISVVCTVFFSLFSGLSIYLIIPLLDTLFNQTASAELVEAAPGPQLPGWFESLKESVSDSFNSFVFGGDQLDALLRICLIVLTAFFLKNLFGFIQAYALAFVEQGVIRDIRNALFRHIHDLSLGFFTHERAGNLISRVTNDVNVIQYSISASFLNLLREPLLVLVFLGIALSISWQLTLISILILPLALQVTSRIGIRIHKESSNIQSKMADITSVLQETITGVKVVKAFGMEKFENRKFTNETKKYFNHVLKITRIRNLGPPVTESLGVLAAVVIIWYGGQQVLIDQTLKASEFLAFLFAILQTMHPLKELSSVSNRLQESAAAGKRVFEILDTKPNIREKPGAVELKDVREKIEFRNVTFAYEETPGAARSDGRAVLKNISFIVKNGEVLAVVGPSGGGKTTLVDLLARFYDPVQGEILIDGVDSRNFTIKSLRAKIGIVTQETILFNDTVRKNIAYGLDDCPFEKIVKAAKAANAHDFILELPNGYDTGIGERGIMLSGGQRQRVAIARAILKNPPIMIFDEATSALDSESEVLVQEAIEHLMERRTCFVIAHRLSTIRNADRIVVLDRGEIVQAGKHQELLRNKAGMYHKLYELQFNV